MNSLISDLLLLAQADSGVLQLQMQPVELDTVLLDVYRQTRRVAERTKGSGVLEIRMGNEDQALIWRQCQQFSGVVPPIPHRAQTYLQ